MIDQAQVEGSRRCADAGNQGQARGRSHTHQTVLPATVLCQVAPRKTRYCKSYAAPPPRNFRRGRYRQTRVRACAHCSSTQDAWSARGHLPPSGNIQSRLRKLTMESLLIPISVPSGIIEETMEEGKKTC